MFYFVKWKNIPIERVAQGRVCPPYHISDDSAVLMEGFIYMTIGYDINSGLGKPASRSASRQLAFSRVSVSIITMDYCNTPILLVPGKGAIYIEFSQ
jgi:hypothetical protein